MPTIEVNADDLLGAVRQMTPSEFDAFIEKAVALRQKPRAATLSRAETKLLSQINRGLPNELTKRSAQLTARLKKGLLTAAEHAELLERTRHAESRDAERAAALVELAKLRRLPLPTLMKHLGIQTPPVHG